MRVSASQRGISWVGYFAALVAVTACSIGVWVLSSDARREIDALAVANADSMQWLLAQAEVEHLIFANALLSADPEDLTSLRDVRTRFDVFYSRISLLDSSRNFVDVRADPEVHAALARITTFLNDTVPLIDGPAEELAAALESLCEEAKALREDLRTISLAGVRVFAEDSETQRSRVANALLDLAILAILLFLGMIGVVLALMRSLAEGQRRTSEIRAAQSHLRSIVTTSLDGILVVDQSGVILDFNGAAERIFGYAPEEAIGQSLAELIVPEHLRAAHHAGMNRYMSTGKKRVIDAGLVQLEAVDKSGRLFPVEMSLSTAESEDGEIFVSYIRDISERVQAEQELVEARDRALAGEKAKASLLAVMSHEMRTPLNGILGSLQLIAETKLTDKQRDYVQVMDSSGRLLLNHVNTVLDISRTDAGKTQAACEPFDPGALLEEVAEGQRVQAEARKNRIEVAEEARAIGVVQGDPVRLQQVLVNLVANAVKFTRNGTITLEAERLAGDMVHFQVTDTGIGIAEDNLDRIFEDFVTLDTSYRREVEGTGLGLGIVRRLVGVMGGEIGVESCLGEGTIFWMDIPLPAMRGAPSPIAVAEATASQDPVATDLSVLLVEDNEINRMVAREMLQGLACAVSEAVDGLAGVERAEERAFDLILMDISMPRLDGIAATERIRAGNGPNARTPIVALTAHALPGEVDRFREAGMSDAVVKPISKDRLREMLASLAPVASGAEPEEEDAATALIELLGAERARTIIGKAFDELSDALDELREMAGQGALHDDIRALSHKMAGTSALIGLTDLRAIFIDIERAGENEDLGAVEQGLDVADHQFLADRARMNEMLGLEGLGAASSCRDFPLKVRCAMVRVNQQARGTMSALPKLFQPLALRGIETRNRVVISPMCQYSAHEGHMEDWHLVQLGRFAIGGAGIVFTEATAVQKCGRITHGCPGLWADTQIPGHARVAQFALRNGAIPAVQLGHAGRKAGMQRPWFGNGPLNEADFARGDMPWTPVGASPLPVAEGWPVPHELTVAEIATLVQDYVAASRRAREAGYKIVEIHGAHGYLVHSFLSPLSNRRTDAYGGDLKGRMRLALEITEAVRAQWPEELPLFFRTSAVDGTPEGWTLDDTVVLARELKAAGVDVMDCSSSGIAGAATAAGGQKRQPGFQVPYAERVRADADMTTMAVGLITHPEQAEAILAEGKADLIAIGREALVDPMWALHAARDLGYDTDFATWPAQSGWWLAGRQKTSDFYKP